MKYLSPQVAVVLLATVFIGIPSQGFSQWIVYNFSPRAAYLNSYGLSTNTDSNANNSRTNGWPTNWNNGSAIGYLALYFSTNTNSPNFITALPPLVFNYTTATNTNLLTTNNYVTNLGSVLALTNTNPGSLSNIFLFNRTRLGGSSSGLYMTAQYTLGSTNTNTVGTFQANLTGYANPVPNTNGQGIGTNGVPVGTNFYPQALTLKISALNSLTNPSSAAIQQLMLPLTINLRLTRTVNTNTNFGSLILTSPLTDYPPTNNYLYVNLPKLIRSNNTYTNNFTP